MNLTRSRFCSCRGPERLCFCTGILIYHDAQFANGGLEGYGIAGPGARGSASEREELTYQVQRLSHHPSIVMFDACNECGGAGLYSSFVMPIIASVDRSRPVWPSCPAPGWISGVDRLTCRPDGGILVTGAGGSPRQPSPFPQEGHGPYTAFMALGAVTDHTIVPPLPVSRTGPGQEGWFRSEFGAVSWSSSGRKT